MANAISTTSTTTAPTTTRPIRMMMSSAAPSPRQSRMRQICPATPEKRLPPHDRRELRIHLTRPLFVSQVEDHRFTRGFDGDERWTVTVDEDLRGATVAQAEVPAQRAAKSNTVGADADDRQRVVEVHPRDVGQGHARGIAAAGDG